MGSLIDEWNKRYELSLLEEPLVLQEDNDGLVTIGFMDLEEPQAIEEGQLETVSSYDPTLREEARYKIIEIATEQFGIDKRKARDFAEKIMGITEPATGLGIGLADLVGVGEVMSMQEGARRAKRGVKSGDITEAALGAVETGLSALGPAAVGAKVAQKITKAVKE